MAAIDPSSPHAEPDNAVEVFRRGLDLYPRMLADIRAASVSVDLEMYIFEADDVGREFGEALKGAATRDADVRVLYDSLGSRETPGSFFADLHTAGIEVREFNPILPFRHRRRWRGYGFSRRNHRKLLVVDRRIAYIGGINVGGTFLDWEDLTVRLDGPIGRDAARSFDDVWTGRFRRVVRSYISRPNRHLRPLAVCDGFPTEQFSPVVRTYIAGIKKTRRELRLAHAYFYPPRRVRKTLVRLARRGVDVSIIVPEHSDIPLQEFAASRFYSYFLRRGVRIFRFPGHMLHAKYATVDDHWATVGSANIDPTSFYLTLEINLVIRRPDVVARLVETFEDVRAQSHELLLSEWARRPLWHKVLERVFYRLRRWLFPGGG